MDATAYEGGGKKGRRSKSAGRRRGRSQSPGAYKRVVTEFYGSPRAGKKTTRGPTPGQIKKTNQIRACINDGHQARRLRCAADTGCNDFIGTHCDSVSSGKFPLNTTTYMKTPANMTKPDAKQARKCIDRAMRLREFEDYMNGLTVQEAINQSTNCTRKEQAIKKYERNVKHWGKVEQAKALRTQQRELQQQQPVASDG